MCAGGDSELSVHAPEPSTKRAFIAGAGEGRMIETFGLTHIALAVQDAERAFRFYQDVFGMVAVYRESGFIQAQTPGCRDVLVLEETGSRPSGSGGIAHFGFRLVDPAEIDEAVRAVERAGGQGHGSPPQPSQIPSSDGSAGPSC
jgi:catechol-2,3-dioxygenase